MDIPQKDLGGRPEKPFDRTECAKLMGMWCTKEEIAGWFAVSVATIERRCKEWAEEIGFENGSFETLRNIYGASTKASIRRSQIQHALNGNTSLLIWLGKNLLGQTETPEITEAAQFQVNYALSEL